MSDWPNAGYLRPTISSFSRECMGAARIASGVDPGTGSATFPFSNVTLYFPVLIEFPLQITKLFWVNGTVVSGNVAMALYQSNGVGAGQGTAVAATGSVAQAGTSAIQKVTLGAPVLLVPGMYQFGLAADNTTATFMRSATSNNIVRLAGGSVQNAFPPPATAGYNGTTTAYWPMCGMSGDPNF